MLLIIYFTVQHLVWLYLQRNANFVRPLKILRVDFADLPVVFSKNDYYILCLLYSRSSSMDGESSDALVTMGHERIFFGRHSSSPVSYEGKRHMRNGQRCFPSESSSVCRRHPLGAPRTLAER